MLMKKTVSALILLASVLITEHTRAATVADEFNVEQIVLDDVNFSGCLARLTPNVNTLISGCGSAFVTMDCNGLLGSTKSQGAAKLSAMQLGLVSDTKVYVRIDNTKKANGFCLAVRVDSLRTPRD